MMKKKYETPEADLIRWLPKERLAVIFDPESTTGSGEGSPVSIGDGDINWEIPV